jgi:hypothetical protein
MRARRSGQLALISSLAAYYGLPVTPSYCASKAALKAYGEAIRGWLASEGVRVSVVMPGYVESQMCREMPGPKPFLWSAERAAQHIRLGLARNRARISFPFPLNLGTWLLAVLPPPCPNGCCACSAIVADSFSPAVLPAVAFSGGLALLVERLLKPPPQACWRRPVAALAIHFGLWLLFSSVLLLLLQRPVFAASSLLAGFLFVVLVSNAKVHSLHEPFIFQDFEYFSDALRHPRLYMPFLGAVRALLSLFALWPGDCRRVDDGGVAARPDVDRGVCHGCGNIGAGRVAAALVRRAAQARRQFRPDRRLAAARLC